MGQMTFRASFEKHKRPEVNELGNTLNWPVGSSKPSFLHLQYMKTLLGTA